MKPTIKRKWLAALRSGKYKQARGTLSRGSRFCCLGVLCDISKQGEWRKRGTSVGRGCAYGEYEGDCLPRIVAEWAGLPLIGNECDTIPMVEHRGKMQTLGALNDNGMKFAEIADLIEKNL